MSSSPLHGRAGDRGGQRGAVAVEAALVISFFLVPILIGVITLGERLWRAQKVDTYALRVPAGAVTGTNLTCAELVDRVRSTVVHNAGNVDGALPAVGAEQVAVEVVEVLPTVGVVVHVSVTSSAADAAAAGLPVGGSLLGETTLRLSHVSVSTESC